jgi:hypothetical protein
MGRSAKLGALREMTILLSLMGSRSRGFEQAKTLGHRSPLLSNLPERSFISIDEHNRLAAKIGDRTRAGMARAKVHGTKSGKPAGQQSLDRETRDQIRQLAGSGTATYVIAKKLGIRYKSAKKYVEER